MVYAQMKAVFILQSNREEKWPMRRENSTKVVGTYAPPSRLAYSSSMRSRYNASASSFVSASPLCLCASQRFFSSCAASEELDVWVLVRGCEVVVMLVEVEVFVESGEAGFSPDVKTGLGDMVKFIGVRLEIVRFEKLVCDGLVFGESKRGFRCFYDTAGRRDGWS